MSEYKIAAGMEFTFEGRNIVRWWPCGTVDPLQDFLAGTFYAKWLNRDEISKLVSFLEDSEKP